MQIQFEILSSLPRVGSGSAEVVTVDAVDMLVGKDKMDHLMQGGHGARDVRLRKILWLTTAAVIY